MFVAFVVSLCVNRGIIIAYVKISSFKLFFQTLFNLSNDSSGQTHNALFDSADMRNLTMAMLKSLTVGRYQDMTWYVNVFLGSISSTFYEQLLRQKIQTMTTENLRKMLLYGKVLCKMLMELTPVIRY